MKVLKVPPPRQCSTCRHWESFDSSSYRTQGGGLCELTKTEGDDKPKHSTKAIAVGLHWDSDYVLTIRGPSTALWTTPSFSCLQYEQAEAAVRVIFLDVDGVLNSEALLRKIDDQHRQLGHNEPSRPKSATTCTCYRLENQIDRAAVARLNRLVAETDAKIVISSSWRKLLDPSELSRVLVSHGLAAEIIGETPDGNSDDSDALRKVYGYEARIYRGHEIDFWLRQHVEVSRFVILDDGGDMAMHRNRLVQTDCEEGLLDEHVDLAIRMLLWDGKTSPSPMDVEESKEAP